MLVDFFFGKESLKKNYSYKYSSTVCPNSIAKRRVMRAKAVRGLVFSTGQVCVRACACTCVCACVWQTNVARALRTMKPVVYAQPRERTSHTASKAQRKIQRKQDLADECAPLFSLVCATACAALFFFGAEEFIMRVANHGPSSQTKGQLF